MGDRGNIKLIGGHEFPTPVCFYTHWMGTVMKPLLADALDRGRERWTDPSYLGRVIFDGLRGDDRSVISFGISSTLGDNEYPILVVDMEEKTVHEEADTRNGFEHITMDKDSIVKPISFEAFVLKYKE